MYKVLFIIGSGSFFGGVSRYLLARFVQNNYLSSFPYGTFWVNILGCFLIGLFYGISEKSQFLTSEWRMFLTVGFCGGFTTFSTFAHENLSLLKDGNFLHLALYASFSVFLGITATYLGNQMVHVAWK